MKFEIRLKLKVEIFFFFQLWLATYYNTALEMESKIWKLLSREESGVKSQCYLPVHFMPNHRVPTQTARPLKCIGNVRETKRLELSWNFEGLFYPYAQTKGKLTLDNESLCLQLKMGTVWRFWAANAATFKTAKLCIWATRTIKQSQCLK